MELNVKKLFENAILPTYATEGSSGFDLYAMHSAIIGPGTRYLIGTGLSFEIPKGFEIQIRPRSGLAYKFGVMSIFGTIDSDYRGEVRVILINLGNGLFTVDKGDRIAQGVFVPVADHISFNTVDEFNNTTERGEGGFGSSGK